jgi:hypothetical protein
MTSTATVGPEKWHGTLHGYVYYRCRCERCKAARLSWQRDYRARHLDRLPDGDERHGTAAGYANYGCHCDACRAAATACFNEHLERVEEATIALRAAEAAQRAAVRDALEAGTPLKQVAKAADVCRQTLYTWQADAQG